LSTDRSRGEIEKELDKDEREREREKERDRDRDREREREREGVSAVVEGNTFVGTTTTAAMRWENIPSSIPS
jgi:hypothetical protein